MIDFEKVLQRVVDKAFVMSKLEDRKEISEKEKRVIRFIGYKIMPIFLKIVTFATLVWLGLYIRNTKGFEVAAVILLVMLILKKD